MLNKNGKFDQGSKPWILDYARDLERINPALGKEIQDKLKTGKVLWYEVHTQIKGGEIKRITERLVEIAD